MNVESRQKLYSLWMLHEAGRTHQALIEVRHALKEAESTTASSPDYIAELSRMAVVLGTTVSKRQPALSTATNYAVGAVEVVKEHYPVARTAVEAQQRVAEWQEVYGLAHAELECFRDILELVVALDRILYSSLAKDYKDSLQFAGLLLHASFPSARALQLLALEHSEYTDARAQYLEYHEMLPIRSVREDTGVLAIEVNSVNGKMLRRALLHGDLRMIGKLAENTFLFGQPTAALKTTLKQMFGPVRDLLPGGIVDQAESNSDVYWQAQVALHTLLQLQYLGIATNAGSSDKITTVQQLFGYEHALLATIAQVSSDLRELGAVSSQSHRGMARDRAELMANNYGTVLVPGLGKVRVFTPEKPDQQVMVLPGAHGDIPLPHQLLVEFEGGGAELLAAGLDPVSQQAHTLTSSGAPVSPELSATLWSLKKRTKVAVLQQASVRAALNGG